MDSVFEIVWSRDPVTGVEMTYGDVRMEEERQFSAYSFDYADVASLWKHLELYEAECLGLLERGREVLKAENEDALQVMRFPVLGAYELALKCSHTFNLLDARGAISVTERVGVMGRIRNLIVGVAKVYAEQGRLVDAASSVRSAA
jgi:glycyl-tRNA synthetase alpha chain